jgi:hypothetical protein
MDILVFKTDIQDNHKVYQASNHLNSIKEIKRWNFDLDDIDKILRIESVNVSPRVIETTLSNAGFMCEELPD